MRNCPILNRGLLRAPLAALLAVALLSPSFAGPKIAVLLKSRTSFWAAVEKGATEAGTRLGAELTMKAPLAETDVAIQIQLFNAAIAQGSEAVVIAPINKEALAVPIASAAIKGIKIVVIDTPLTGNAAPVFIGTDQEAAGQAAGRLLAQLTAETDEVALLRNNQSSGASTQREVGALAAFRAVRPQSVIHADLYAGSEPGAEEAKCQLLLTAHPHVTAILASATPVTRAMLKVLDQQKLAGSIKLIGFGFNLNPEIAAAIERGALHGWIAQLPTQMGTRGIESAVALLKGEAVTAVVHTDFVVVTKDNLKDAAVQALLAL